MKYPIMEMLLLVLFFALIFFVLFKFKKNREISIFNTMLSEEEIEVHAKRAALTHTVVTKKI